MGMILYYYKVCVSYRGVLLLASIYHDIQTAMSRDSNLYILPLRHKSVRKPL